MSQYGEPWTAKNFRIKEKHGAIVCICCDDGWVSDSDDKETATRIVACVNALAGKRPEKLADLLNVLNDFLHAAPDASLSISSYQTHLNELRKVVAEVKAALAAFEDKPC